MAGAPARFGPIWKQDPGNLFKLNIIKLHMTKNERYETTPHQWEASVITCISDRRDSRQFE